MRVRARLCDLACCGETVKLRRCIDPASVRAAVRLRWRHRSRIGPAARRQTAVVDLFCYA